MPINIHGGSHNENQNDTLTYDKSERKRLLCHSSNASTVPCQEMVCVYPCVCPCAGAWGSGVQTYGDYHNYSTGSFVGTSGSVYGIEFKSDGTFSCFRILAARLGNDDTVSRRQHNGNFRVDGNAIYLSNITGQLEFFRNGAPAPNDSWGPEHVNDHVLTFNIAFYELGGGETIHIYLDGPIDHNVYFGTSNSMSRICD